MKEIIYTNNQIAQVAQQLLHQVQSKTLCFYGAMGAGKTTLIKVLVKELGGVGTTNSPTFGIVNEYHLENGAVLGYHFDFYRLKHETEVLDLGLEDYLSQDVWIFMEWPEKINSFLPRDISKINIEVLDTQTRKIIF
ncbi:tRNA (adenosine(37)-N6)-threonylcarbamoyltransferase complex ATPase subunit type 1 TsaE [Ulvibacterium sp.]|uniref:tRNA (adenosine(37)-N6)-threonylcarbamoyltransferase complex ATPase subunit type 1 TsaE n=1 Tax=Ulvibacterium sp. TaxID=2665914 RepID=UPI002607142E|nr:tRNA (adenosine(37)-N6)-threonylcarbamoyltransferase complex ATPase subunit type 1 TsaE [Ulvibacterium sp.]